MSVDHKLPVFVIQRAGVCTNEGSDCQLEFGYSELAGSLDSSWLFPLVRVCSARDLDLNILS